MPPITSFYRKGLNKRAQTVALPFRDGKNKGEPMPGIAWQINASM
jgi:hypothetical protein